MTMHGNTDALRPSISRREAFQALASTASLAVVTAATVATPVAWAEPVADPLLAVVREYRFGLNAYNTLGEEVFLAGDGDRRADLTWRPAFQRLCSNPPEPTTLEGAIEAVRCVRDEIVSDEEGDFTGRVLTAALAFLDRSVA